MKDTEKSFMHNIFVQNQMALLHSLSRPSIKCLHAALPAARVRRKTTY